MTIRIEMRLFGATNIVALNTGSGFLRIGHWPSADIYCSAWVTVNAKRQSGQVLGIDGAKRGFRFPVWQLDKDGRPFGALPALHAMLGDSAWAVYRFLVSRHGALDGRTGL